MLGATIIGNEISLNWANVYGGGIYFQFGGQGLVERCLIYANNSEVGAGIAVDASPLVQIIHNTIANNTAEVWGGGIFTATFSYPVIINTIVYGNSASNYENLFTAADDSFNIAYSDIENGWTGEGNIDADPLFANPPGGDYSLTWNNYPLEDSTKSPCIDAGNPRAPLDPDSTIADMGYLYFNQSLSAIEDLTVKIEGEGLRLTWGAVPGALEYKIYSSQIPFFNLPAVPEYIVNPPDTTFQVEFLPNHPRFYRVTSAN